MGRADIRTIPQMPRSPQLHRVRVLRLLPGDLRLGGVLPMTLAPLTQWARNKIRQHGAEFEVLRELPGKVLVQSLGKTWKGPNGMEKWMGWFEIGVDANVIKETA